MLSSPSALRGVRGSVAEADVPDHVMMFPAPDSSARRRSLVRRALEGGECCIGTPGLPGRVVCMISLLGGSDRRGVRPPADDGVAHASWFIGS